jgi:hypothetical protein
VATRGCDYSWDHPDLNCLWNQGVRFLVRYGSRDPSKNLTRAELDAALDRGMAVAVVWQEGKTQMMRGYDGGVTDARDARALFDGLGLPGIPVHYSCDQETSVLSSADIGKIDAYLDGTLSVTGLARSGMYGDYGIIKREFDRGKITFGWQTYAWSGGKWDARAQLRQVHNNQNVCGGYIDWDEAHHADYGQWPRPAAPQPAAAALEDPVVIPPRSVSDRQVAVCLNGPHRDFGICVDAGVLQGSVHVRAALHMVSGGWHVIQVYADPAHNRPVVHPPGPYDGASLHRQDDQPVDVWPVFTPG